MWCSNNRVGRHRNGGVHTESSCSGSNWTGMNLVAMILGFVVFWPLGLFMVFWICSGRHVSEIPAAAQELWAKISGGASMSREGLSDNVVFNDYQQTQFDRIREIKEEIKTRAQRFSDYRADAKRRADEEEFNRFMNDTPNKGEASS